MESAGNSGESPKSKADSAAALKERIEGLAQLERYLITKARTNPATFCEYVLRDEKTARTIHNSENHEQWHRILNEHDRVVVWAHVEAAKTSQLSVGRVLWELGRNPRLRIACVSNTDGMALKIGSLVGKYITSSPELHAVFPDLKPDPDSSWTAHSFTVARDTLSKDPSFQTCGVHGNILGSRIDLLILDDILDHESTYSQNMREGTNEWYIRTVPGRLTEESRIWAVGMMWHDEDLLHMLAANPLFYSVISPVVDAEGKSTWLEQWPAERIQKKRVELGPLEFDRQMLCRCIRDGEARFKPEWIKLCMERGDGKTMTYALSSVPDGYRIYTGVDLAVSEKETSAETVLFTIAVHPDETRELLNIEAGRWHGPDIVNRIIDVHARYHCIVVVESNAAQEYISQFTRKLSAVPVVSFTTTGSKHHPEFGVESIGVEMSNSKWIIPNVRGVCHPEVDKWISELVYYDPRAHTGDRLMASWFAREGARMAMARTKAKSFQLDTMSR